jgi:hypothetical protein
MLKTARPEVDNLDFRVQRMRQKDVLRFKVAMYYFVLFQEHQAAEKLLGESSNDL